MAGERQQATTVLHLAGGSLLIKAQQPQSLLEHPPQEEGIADEVALPEAARLDEQPAQSLQAVVRHPTGGTAQFAGDVIEHRTTGESYVRLDTVPVFHQPAFLQGHPQAHDEDIRFDSIDLLDHGLVFRAAEGLVEVAVMRADDAQVGKPGFESGSGLVRHARAGTRKSTAPASAMARNSSGKRRS